MWWWNDLHDWPMLGVYAACNDVSLYGDVRSHDVFHDASYGRPWAAQKHNGNAQ